MELKDTLKAHVMLPDGSYEKVDLRGKQKLNSQELFCEEAVASAQKTEQEEEGNRRVFIPETHVEV